MQLQSYKSVKGGFTLIELMVAIAMIAVLFTIGFSSLREFSRRQDLGTVVSTAIGDLRSTQQNALTGIKLDGCNQLDAWSFTIVNGNSYRIKAECTDASSLPVSVKLKDVPLPEGITVTATRNIMFFKALGQGTNLTADNIITFTQPTTGKTGTVTITKEGSIK